MRVAITQIRKTSANEALPQFITTEYGEDDTDTERGDGPITAIHGYEICAVYIFPDTADVSKLAAVTS